MVSTGATAFQLSPSEHQVQLRRAVIASTIGTAIEWYDFFLYSTVTGLVFAKLFFPNSDPWVPPPRPKKRSASFLNATAALFSSMRCARVASAISRHQCRRPRRLKWLKISGVENCQPSIRSMQRTS